jgi:methionine synthase I (cobalamin-dependent)
MSRFLKALHSSRVLLMDGAMGTELQRAGLQAGEDAAAWILLHPERVKQVHQGYRAVGAEVLLTNTFTINAASLLETLDRAGRLPVDMLAVWRKAFQLLGTGGTPPYRLADLGPIAGRIAEREFDGLTTMYSTPGLYEAADALLLETCSSPRVRLALRRIGNRLDRPLLLSLTYRRDESGRLTTFSGHAPEWFARRARDWGVAALGVNCGRDIGLEETIEIVRRYRQATDLPLFARPNAGTPRRVGNRWFYPLTPQQFAVRLPELLEAGVTMVGGCCGTTPEHIAALRPVVSAWNASRSVEE